MARENTEAIAQFYDQLQTVPKLISDLALGVAEAQTRLDLNYVDSLNQYARSIFKLLEDGKIDDKQFISLFQATAPSRYQFTETIVEVRADLQASAGTETKMSASVGINAGPFAVTINASYTKRHSYDYRAAARIRTVLNAIPANDQLLDSLLKNAKNLPALDLPEKSQSKGIAALGEGMANAVPKTDTTPS